MFVYYISYVGAIHCRCPFLGRGRPTLPFPCYFNILICKSSIQILNKCSLTVEPEFGFILNFPKSINRQIMYFIDYLPVNKITSPKLIIRILNQFWIQIQLLLRYRINELKGLHIIIQIISSTILLRIHYFNCRSGSY